MHALWLAFFVFGCMQQLILQMPPTLGRALYMWTVFLQARVLLAARLQQPYNLHSVARLTATHAGIVGAVRPFFFFTCLCRLKC